jgi:hypothetical protein
MTDLTDGERRALNNLAGKGEGDIASFLNIADARRLTELGLARRTQQGWEITPAGTAHLEPIVDPDRPTDVLDFKAR